MLKKIMKFILKIFGYKYIAMFFQNIFRTRFATDMYISQCNVVAETHKKTFRGYKNKYAGQDIAIIATGPSLTKYKPLNNVINIGVNKAIFYEKVKLDYYFAIDYNVTKNYLKTLQDFPEIKKFYGVVPRTSFGWKYVKLSQIIIPESIILEQNASKFYVYKKEPILPMFLNTDIDKTWIGDGLSCIFSAMQFAMFTNPKRIYLVGCDCSSGYFDGKKGADCSFLIKSWQELKKFADIYYPDTEIISVNPVGLKGLFTDLYQNEENNEAKSI